MWSKWKNGMKKAASTHDDVESESEQTKNSWIKIMINKELYVGNKWRTIKPTPNENGLFSYFLFFFTHGAADRVMVWDRGGRWRGNGTTDEVRAECAERSEFVAPINGAWMQKMSMANMRRACVYPRYCACELQVPAAVLFEQWMSNCIMNSNSNKQGENRTAERQKTRWKLIVTSIGKRTQMDHWNEKIKIEIEISYSAEDSMNWPISLG